VDVLTADASALLVNLRTGLGDPASLRRTLGNVEALTSSIRKDIEPLIAKTTKALDGVDNVTSIVGPTEKKELQKALDGLVTRGARSRWAPPAADTTAEMGGRAWPRGAR